MVDPIREVFPPDWGTGRKRAFNNLLKGLADAQIFLWSRTHNRSLTVAEFAVTAHHLIQDLMQPDIAPVVATVQQPPPPPPPSLEEQLEAAAERRRAAATADPGLTTQVLDSSLYPEDWRKKDVTARIQWCDDLTERSKEEGARSYSGQLHTIIKSIAEERCVVFKQSQPVVQAKVRVRCIAQSVILLYRTSLWAEKLYVNMKYQWKSPRIALGVHGKTPGRRRPRRLWIFLPDRGRGFTSLRDARRRE